MKMVRQANLECPAKLIRSIRNLCTPTDVRQLINKADGYTESSHNVARCRGGESVSKVCLEGIKR